ncbi:hypothetical protein LZ009_16090 [Ramlibacter sp. XY19]|uniref:hypothetical protein n=1 Tax=Ramlibacter paludis TaxID=2908000 RepID=UPI0023DAB4E6|nr:hypothetical protein [Ramlibacter paludis]MCG2594299.1 hypothetical protein [Ramlibacter paludis]
MSELTLDPDAAVEPPREGVLNPVDRLSEFLFGLLMALSFTGAVAVASAGKAEIRELFITSFGCNLAWGLVDAVMYIVRTVTDRGRNYTLARGVKAAATAQEGRALIEASLSKTVAGLVSPAELEGIRGRIVALPSVPERPRIHGEDLLAALAVFLIVVASTFPVVLPFGVMQDVGLAKDVSRGIAVVLLFLGGLGFGRYAGYGSWRSGFIMAAVGTLLVGAIKALGG